MIVYSVRADKPSDNLIDLEELSKLPTQDQVCFLRETLGTLHELIDELQNRIYDNQNQKNLHQSRADRNKLDFNTPLSARHKTSESEHSTESNSQNEISPNLTNEDIEYNKKVQLIEQLQYEIVDLKDFIKSEKLKQTELRQPFTENQSYINKLSEAILYLNGLQDDQEKHNNKARQQILDQANQIEQLKQEPITSGPVSFQEANLRQLQKHRSQTIIDCSEEIRSKKEDIQNLVSLNHTEIKRLRELIDQRKQKQKELMVQSKQVYEQKVVKQKDFLLSLQIDEGCSTGRSKDQILSTENKNAFKIQFQQCNIEIIPTEAETVSTKQSRRVSEIITKQSRRSSLHYLPLPNQNIEASQSPKSKNRELCPACSIF